MCLHLAALKWEHSRLLETNNRLCMSKTSADSYANSFLFQIQKGSGWKWEPDLSLQTAFQVHLDLRDCRGNFSPFSHYCRQELFRYICESSPPSFQPLCFSFRNALQQIHHSELWLDCRPIQQFCEWECFLTNHTVGTLLNTHCHTAQERITS